MSICSSPSRMAFHQYSSPLFRLIWGQRGRGVGSEGGGHGAPPPLRARLRAVPPELQTEHGGGGGPARRPLPVAGGGGETPTALRGAGGSPLLQAQPEPPSPGGLGPPQGVWGLLGGFGASPALCCPISSYRDLRTQFWVQHPPGSQGCAAPGGKPSTWGPVQMCWGGGFRNPGPAGGLRVALTQKEPSPRLPQGLAPRAGAWAAKEAEMSPAAPRRPCSPRAPASCLRHPRSARIRGPAPPGERAASLPGGRAASRVAALGAGVPDSLLSFGLEERGGLLFLILF